MKVCERDYKIEGLKTMINYKDVITILVSILGLVLSNIQAIELSKVSTGNVEELFIYNFVICAVIVFSNVYIWLNKRTVSKIEEDKFIYDLKMNVDQRGSFTEFIRTNGQGQVSGRSG